jgi:hypothetical protein
VSSLLKRLALFEAAEGSVKVCCCERGEGLTGVRWLVLETGDWLGELLVEDGAADEAEAGLFEDAVGDVLGGCARADDIVRSLVLDALR